METSLLNINSNSSYYFRTGQLRCVQVYAHKENTISLYKANKGIYSKPKKFKIALEH
jgi:hypothetical protein